MDYATARHNMVEAQLRTNRVIDPALLAALGRVPREIFVPRALAGGAYVDGAIPIGRGRALMEPMVFARLVQEAAIKATDVVLDIGCGSGYGAAVLSHVASTVVALETDRELLAAATAALASLAIDNVAVVSGKLAEGDAAHGPYDVIILEGQVASVPHAIRAQLVDGGRLLAVEDDADGLGRAILYSRFGDSWSHRILFDATAPRLPGFAAVARFEF